MTLPNTGISTSLVRSTIGAATNDVGSLCTHPNINKWSKWKPVLFNSVNGLTVANLQSANFGLQPSASSTSYASVVSLKWGYNRPAGGASSPYRLGDFRNYNHTAMAICQAPSKIEVNLSVSNNLRSMLSINMGGSDHLIGLNDFSGLLGSLYYCVVLTTSGGTWIVTADANLGNGGSSIDKLLPVAARLEGTTGTVYHVLATTTVSGFTAIGSAPANIYYSLPSADNQNNTSAYEVMTSPVLGDTDVTWGVKGISEYMTGIPDNINTYLGIDKPPFPTTGNIYIKYRMKNVGSNNGIFEGGNLFIEANPTYFGANTNKFKAYMYDMSGNIISSIVIAPNQEVDFVIGASSVLNRNGTVVATPTPDTEIYSNIGIYKSVSGSYSLVTGIGLSFIAQ